MNQAVTWRALLLTSAASVLITLAIGAALLITFPIAVMDGLKSPDGASFPIRLPDRLPMKVTMPEGMQATVTNPVDIRMPLQDPLSVPIDKTFKTPVTIDTSIPIHLNVHFSDRIPVRETMALDTNVRAKIFGVWMDFPVEGQIPINLDVPVSVTIPVQKEIPVRINTPVRVDLDEVFSVPADTLIEGNARLLSPLSIQSQPLVLGFEDQVFNLPLPWRRQSEPTQRGE